MGALSLASRFLITLAASAVLPLLLYGWFSLRGMREQIDEQVVRVFLPQLAADHAQQVEAHLERADRACAIVREIARRALDSPEDMAEFEEQVELVPDLLDNLLDLLILADADGRVVYWRDGQRLDPSAHGRRAALIPASVAADEWFQCARERGACVLPWGRSPYLHRGLDHRSMDPASHHLGVAFDVPRADGRPGALFALQRWAEIQLLLDDARHVLVEDAHLGSAEVFLLGRNGVVQAHTDRRRYGLPLAPPALAASLVDATAIGRATFSDETGRRWRAGFAPGGGRGARSFVLGVAVPEAELFAASDAFERVLVIAILVTIIVLVVWSLIASRAITAPIEALVAATRRVAAGDLDVTVPARGGPELGDLATAFNQMARELAAGRERLAAVEREQAWAEMARQVAHEIKNPLQPMRLVAQLLQRARADGDPRAEQIAARLARTVLEQTEALDRIASDFRAFAGVAPARRTRVQVDAWLRELHAQLNDLFEGRPVQIGCEPGAGDTTVDIDPIAMARVFVNLVQNAHEAAPAGVAILLSAHTDDGRVAMRIADDGPGLAPAARARLFEPYFTTKSSGTGLGLAICRRLVEAHGGSIRLAGSRPGETVFVIDLPAAAR